MEPNNADGACSAQLHAELQSHATHESFDVYATRPVLKHLNADTSWLLSLPYPKHIQPPVGRCRYNIVIDAWLQGEQVDFFRWFSSQEHARPSSVQSLSELNTLLGKAESVATGTSPSEEIYYIDAICCSHEFTDHCHEATLEAAPGNVPIFAVKKAAALIRSWRYFDSVVEIPEFKAGSDYKQATIQSWINIRRVCTKGDGPAFLHSALLFTFKLDIELPSEIIIYTPHGIQAESLKPALSPADEILALLHGLHDISLAGSQLNLGRDNALKIAEALQVQYWSPTHDEVKIAHGLVAYLLKRSSHTLGIAPGSHPITEDNSHVPEPHYKNFVNIDNGECLVLDR